jgi:hypothetical protein
VRVFLPLLVFVALAGPAHAQALLTELASPNEEPFGYFGRAVAGVPDASGDGRGDLLVGAYQEDPGDAPESVGRAYLFSGDSTAVAVEGAPSPSALALHAPRPNPFAREAVLSFTLAGPGAVRLAVCDVPGREVAVLVEGMRGAGRHAVAFDGSALPGGTYLVRLAAGGEVQSRPVTLVR